MLGQLQNVQTQIRRHAAECGIWSESALTLQVKWNRKKRETVKYDTPKQSGKMNEMVGKFMRLMHVRIPLNVTYDVAMASPKSLMTSLKGNYQEPFTENAG